MPNQCVPEPELERFIFGNLEVSELRRIAEHVDHCEPCQDTVVALAEESNTFVETIRNAGEIAEVPHEGALKLGLKRMLASLRENHPGSNAAVLAPNEANEPVDSTSQIGPYRIEEQLGNGGMGHVYRAMHTKLKRVVALKVLPASRWANSAAVSRFEREMEAIGGLDHPHIVRASDAGEDNGMQFLVMEYIDGLDLSQLVNRLGKLPVDDACEVARQCAIGLHHAHERGLVHRDVKPSNLMLAAPSAGSSQGQPTLKILDLGLALLGDEHLQDGHELTTVGTLMGTLDYMSPEQGIDSHSVDQRTDIYSLGATLFKLLTGRAPYADPQFNSLMKKMTALATKPAPSIGEIRGDLPGGVIAVVDKMLSRDPDERFDTAEEVSAALAPFTARADIATLLRRAIETEEVLEARPSHVPVTSLIGASPKSSDHQTEEQVTTTASSGDKGSSGWMIGIAFAFVAGLCGVLFYMATDVGVLKITSEDPNATVLVKRSNKTVETLQIKNGKGEIRLWSGQYQLVVKGDTQVTIEPSDIQIQRNGKEVSHVRGRSEAIDATANNIAAAAKQGVTVEDDVAFEDEADEETWDGKRARLTEEARALVRKGDLAAALKKYDTALKKNRWNPRLKVEKANVLRKLGWADEATKMYESVATYMRDNDERLHLSSSEQCELYLAWGSTLSDNQEYNQAVSVLSNGLEETGLTDPKLWYQLGIAQRGLARSSMEFATPQSKRETIEASRESFQRTLQLAPNHQQARIEIEKIEAEFSAEEKAETEFRADNAKLKMQVQRMIDDHTKTPDDSFLKLLNRVRKQRAQHSPTEQIIQPGTVLQIATLGTTPDRPIAGQYAASMSGRVNLGPGYGSTDVLQMTTDEAQLIIDDHLSKFLVSPVTAVTFFRSSETGTSSSSAGKMERKASISQFEQSAKLSSVGPVYKQFNYDYWLNALRNDRDPETQRNAMEAIGVLGGDRSFEAATEILKAARQPAGARVSYNEVAIAMSALQHKEVVAAIVDELKNGNERSRGNLNGVLSKVLNNGSTDMGRLHAAISEKAAELTNIRFAHSSKSGDEADAELGFLLLMLDQFDVEPKRIRDVLAENLRRFPVNREERVLKLTESLPDLPGLAERIIKSDISFDTASQYAKHLGAENVRPAASQLVEILKSWEFAFDNYGSSLRSVIEIVGELGADGIDAIPTLVDIATYRDISKVGFNDYGTSSARVVSSATVALSKLNALNPSNEAKSVFRSTRSLAIPRQGIRVGRTSPVPRRHMP